VTDDMIVVFTFDDGNVTIFKVAFAAMQRYDKSWAATHFLPAVYPGQPGNVTINDLKVMEAAGWETGGHGYVHENLSSVPLDSVKMQVEASYNFLVSNGLSHESFAYPYGNYNYEAEVVVSGYFKNIRATHDFTYVDGVNRRELGYYAVRSNQTVDDLIGRVERARMQGSPLVIFGFHYVLPDTAAPITTYYCRESVFKGLLEYLSQQHLRIYSVKKAMELLCGD
jgi:peptidoglycan/xylan/chitin deacetylase (PgdA/CDA1 family)